MFGDLYCFLFAKNDLVYERNIGEKKHSELIKSRNEVTDLAGEFIQTDRDFTRKLLYL